MSPKEPLISVIIPVYNAEPYLKRALDSLLSQTLQNWEAICIDDGSKDASALILDSYGALDERFIIRHTPNGGAAHARNLALQEARGEYITMLDADDWLDSTALEKLSTPLRLHPTAALSICGIARHRGENPTYIMQVIDRTAPASVEEVANAALLSDIMVCSCSKMYRRSIIEQQKLRYREGFKVGEDAFFVLCYLAHTQRFAGIPETLYHYDLSETSIIKAYFKGEVPLETYLSNLSVPMLAGEYALTVSFPSVAAKTAYYDHLLRRTLIAYTECMHTGGRYHREYRRPIFRTFLRAKKSIGVQLPLTLRIILPLVYFYRYGKQRLVSSLQYRVNRLLTLFTGKTH